MKKSKILFLAVLAVAFVASTTLSINAYSHGDKKAAVEYAGIAMLAISVPVVPSASLSLGLKFGKPAGIEALERNASRFGTKTQGSLANVVAQDGTLYVRRQITATGGIFRLIDATNVKTQGITNIDKNKLPDGQNIGIEAIRIAQGSHATIVDPKNIINYTNVSGSIEAELRHADLVISQDSKEVFRCPISSMLTPAAATNGSLKDSAYDLTDNPFVLVENVPFEINIEFPAVMGTSSASTNKFHVEVELYGKITGRKFA